MSKAHATPLRVMVVDDHTLFRRGLVALIEADRRCVVVGQAGDANEAQRIAAACRPQVILLDNHLPGVSGVLALPALLAAAPGAQVLMLTMSEEASDLAAAMRGGAAGYLLKTADSDELVCAIERAARGVSTFSEAILAKMAEAFRGRAPASMDAALQPPLTATPPPGDSLAALSPRERDIAMAVAAGASNKETARRLAIAETTVKIHIQHILRKLGFTSRVQIATWVAAQSVKPRAGS